MIPESLEKEVDKFVGQAIGRQKQVLSLWLVLEFMALSFPVYKMMVITLKYLLLSESFSSSIP